MEADDDLTDRMRDWSSVPPEILTHVLECLNCTDSDTRRIRGVCTSWRSSLPLKPSMHFPLPIILPKHQALTIFPEFADDFNRFGNLCQSKFYLISSSETSSSFSVWLTRVEESLQVHPNKWKLQNPLSPVEDYRKLPKLKAEVNFLDYGISEVARSYSFTGRRPIFKSVRIVMLQFPTSEEFSLLALGDYGTLVVFKSGAQEWVNISCEGSTFSNVIAYNRRFYAIDLKGKLISIDPFSFEVEEIITRSHLVHMEEHNEEEESRALSSYLVVSCGRLYLVNKFVLNNYFYNSTYDDLEPDYNNGEPLELKVFCLSNSCSSDGEVNSIWKPVTSLGDQVFFLSNYVTFSVSASEIGWGEGNCIFFTQGFSVPRNYLFGDDEICFESTLEFFSRFCGLYRLDDNKIITADHLPSECANTFWPVPTWLASTEPCTSHNYADFDLLFG